MLPPGVKSTEDLLVYTVGRYKGLNMMSEKGGITPEQHVKEAMKIGQEYSSYLEELLDLQLQRLDALKKGA